jgi:hypothetical protein
VLLAAMTGAGEASGAHYFNAFEPCCPYGEGHFAPGGVVLFFWPGPTALSEAEEQEWRDYVALLDDADRASVMDLWSLADRNGKQKLLAQVRKMRPTKSGD